METPSIEIFDEMKKIAIEISKNDYNKIDKIKNIENYKDNAMVIYRMFGYRGKISFITRASLQTLIYINKNKILWK